MKGKRNEKVFKKWSLNPDLCCDVCPITIGSISRRCDRSTERNAKRKSCSSTHRSSNIGSADCSICSGTGTVETKHYWLVVSECRWFLSKKPVAVH